MDEEMLRFLMMAGFITAVIIIAAIAGELSHYSISTPFESYYPTMEYSSVTELLEANPLEERVSVTGTVSRINDDYTSDSGSVYQQFFLSDGSMEVKVFCSKAGGSADLSVGDKIFVQGKFQKYFDSLEIYSECSSVNRIGK